MPQNDVHLSTCMCCQHCLKSEEYFLILFTQIKNVFVFVFLISSSLNYLSRNDNHFYVSLVWHRQWMNCYVLNTAELMGLPNVGSMVTKRLSYRQWPYLNYGGEIWYTSHSHCRAYKNSAQTLLTQATPHTAGKAREAATKRQQPASR